MAADCAASAVMIRRCVPGDETALSLVGQASFLEAFAGTLAGPAIVTHCLKQHSVEKYASFLADPCSSLWVAEARLGAAPVGYALLTTPDLPLPDISDTDTEIKRIYVLHRFQGGGLGRRLMEVAHAHARAIGKRRALLGVYGQNTAAIGFYERIGYRKVGERRFNVGGNFYDDLVMALSL